ncbi:uncharacterized protein LOC132204201 [Neocloeon triangulifer]|uniref:uncharacterized protein LOC132204201 n=1 Tax=Neocloeon triangulifer TaxID=2078957 RepID=UPI00286EC459|nr:uncharacterized protein LOC132204201 [Neocloeon triangulifer]
MAYLNSMGAKTIVEFDNEKLNAYLKAKKKPQQSHIIHSAAPKVPWNEPKVTDPNLKISDTAFFREFVTGENSPAQKDFNAFFYQTWDLAMPFVLPREYLNKSYNMFQNADENPQEGMRSALYFFWTNAAHGKEFYKILHAGENYKELMKTNIIKYLREVRKGVDPRFEEAAMYYPKAYIMDPMLLLQILHNPALLNQWLVVVYSFYLKICSKLCLAPAIDIDPVLDSIHEHLRRLAQMLLQAIDSFFQYLSGLITKPLQPNQPFRVDHKQIVTIFKISNILDYFGFGHREVFWNLKLWKNKSMSFSLNFDNPSKLMGSKQPSLNLLSWSIYNPFLFWKKNKCSLALQGWPSEKKKSKNPQPEEVGTPTEKCLYNVDSSHNNYSSKAILTALNKYLKEDIAFEKEWLAAAGNNVEKLIGLLDITEENYYEHPFAGIFENTLLWFKDACKGICEEDFGLLHSIFLAHADFAREECNATLKTTVWVYLSQNGILPQAPKIASKERSEMLRQQKLYNEDVAEFRGHAEKFEENWTIDLGFWIEDLVDRATPGKISYSLLKTLSTADLVNGFCSMIDQTDLDMVKSQYLDKKKSDYPYEINVVHYVLPWFVAAYQFLAKDKEWSKQKSVLDKYKIVVFTLLSNYKTSKCVSSSNWSDHSIPSVLSLLSKTSKVSFADALKWKLNCVQSEYKRLFQGGPPVPVLDSIFLEQFKMFLVFDSHLDFRGKDKLWENNFAISSKHAYRFLSKVAQSLNTSARDLNLTDFPDKMFSTKLHNQGLWLFFDLLNGLLTSKKLKIDHDGLFNKCSDILFGKLFLQKVDKTLELEFESLRLEQIAGILIYLIVNNLDPQKRKRFQTDFKSLEPLDEVERAVFGVVRNDPWETKQVLSQWFNNSDRQDQSLISLESAKSSANDKFYSSILSHVNPDMTLKLKNKGEITFFPIKHCRWCGKLDPEEFITCKECSEEEEYPDVNFFCSETCEENAMEKIHRHEHETYLIAKCEMSFR